MDSAQTQKYLTFNSAISYLDALVNPTVFNRTTSTPPVSPTEGDRYIIGSAPTGAWTGLANRIAVYIGTNWVIFTPSEGWNVYDQGANEYVSFDGASWVTLASLVGGPGGGSSFVDNAFELVDNLDGTKKAVFQLSGFPTSTTYTYTLPNSSSTLAILAGTQTFTGITTFSGTFDVSAATASLGTAVVASTANVGSGAITTGLTKTVNLGTAGLSGSTTGVNIGSAIAGALGTLVVNSPTVTFASTVSAIAMDAANLSVLRTGIGGATADATNRLSVNTPNVLFNNAGTNIDMTFNKNASGNDATMSFKTGFSTRAIVGLAGSDDLTVKVSPDGTSFFDAFSVARATGLMSVANGLTVVGALTLPAASVTLANQANVATARILGRTTAGTGVQEALTAAQATAILDEATAALKGLGPVRSGVATDFLSGTGVYSAPLPSLASDPGSPADGDAWYNSTTDQLRMQMNGLTRILDAGPIPHQAPGTGHYVPMTMGGSSGALTTLIGAANRMDIYPFTPRGDLTIDRLSINCTTAVAASTVKIVLYASDTNGKPAALIVETATLDTSSTGVKEATVSQTLRKGVTYWVGVRHSSTATLSLFGQAATPELTTDGITVNPRKVLRRTLTYATAATDPWGYLVSEVTSATTILACAIWMRST